MAAGQSTPTIARASRLDMCPSPELAAHEKQAREPRRPKRGPGWSLPSVSIPGRCLDLRDRYGKVTDTARGEPRARHHDSPGRLWRLQASRSARQGAEKRATERGGDFNDAPPF